MSLIKAGDQLAKHSVDRSCVWAAQMRIDESPFRPIWVTLTKPCMLICPKYICYNISPIPHGGHANGLKKDKDPIFHSQPKVEQR